MTGSQPPAMPDGERPGGTPLPAKLEPLVETARAYARAATSKNTNRAYAADWRDFLRWRTRQGLDLKPLADPECVGLYLAALASGAKGAGGRSRTVATIERRLSARGDLSERDREEKFSGHSLRAGLASSAEIDERYVQKHLGHASAEMTRRYQRRRDRFRVNLTKAAGL